MVMPLVSSYSSSLFHDFMYIWICRSNTGFIQRKNPIYHLGTPPISRLVCVPGCPLLVGRQKVLRVPCYMPPLVGGAVCCMSGWTFPPATVLLWWPGVSSSRTSTSSSSPAGTIGWWQCAGRTWSDGSSLQGNRHVQDFQGRSSLSSQPKTAQRSYHVSSGVSNFHASSVLLITIIPSSMAQQRPETGLFLCSTTAAAAACSGRSRSIILMASRRWHDKGRVLGWRHFLERYWWFWVLSCSSSVGNLTLWDDDQRRDVCCKPVYIL